VAAWLRRSRTGGLEAFVPSQEAGAPAGPQPLPPAVCAHRQARLATSSGVASDVELPQGLRQAFSRAVP
jgi:hypothetical protein